MEQTNYYNGLHGAHKALYKMTYSWEIKLKATPAQATAAAVKKIEQVKKLPKYKH